MACGWGKGAPGRAAQRLTWAGSQIRRKEDRDPATFDLSVVAGLLFLPLGLHLPYFPVWLASRGLTDVEIAAALGTPMILRVVATPLIAAFADRRGIGVGLAACAVTLFASYCGLRFAVGFAPIFVGALLVAVAMGSMPALADALTLTEIRRAEVSGRRIAYGHIRAWTSIGVLCTMLLSGRIVAALPGERIIVALAALSVFSVAVAIFAAIKMNATRLYSLEGAGRLSRRRFGAAAPRHRRHRRGGADPGQSRRGLFVCDDSMALCGLVG